MRHRRYKKINVNKILKTKQKSKQIKIHIEQMTKYDIQYLAQKIRDIDISSLKLSQHVIDKKEDRFTLYVFKKRLNEILANIEDYIIEYNEIPISTKRGQDIDKRVLIRDKYNFNGLNLCFVLSFTTNVIVTAYWVNIDDNHENLNWSRYNKVMYISV